MDTITGSENKGIYQKREKNQNSIEFMDEGQVKVRGNSGIKQLIITMSENEELKDFYVESINFDENKEKIVTLAIRMDKDRKYTL